MAIELSTVVRISLLALAFASACTSGEESCHDAFGCSDAEVCEEGVCRVSAAEGAPCREDRSCNSESNVIVNGRSQVLSCSNATNRCVLEGEVNAPCNQASDCGLLLLCEQGTCIKPRENGSACDRDEVCRTRFCHPLAKTCGKSEVGGPCDQAEHCDHLLACIGGKCGERLGAGAQCSLDDECLSAECSDDRQCVGNAGDPCGEAGPCEKDLRCAEALDGEQRCVHTTKTACGSEAEPSCNGEPCGQKCAVCETQRTGESGVENGQLVNYVASYCMPF